MSANPIAFIDLKAQQAKIREKVDARIKAVLDHGQYINGPEIAELEEKLAAYTGAKAVVGVSSGTDSLIIAMMAEGIGAGDAVFCPAFTYNATINAILMVGATPVLVDVDKRSFNMDVGHLGQQIEAVVEAGELTPRMVIPVDLFGLPAEYEAISGLAAKYEMMVMADAAQSFGGGVGNRKVGNLAPISSTSFFPAKTLGCYGDGGALFTDDEERAEIWRSIRFHGTDEGRRSSVRVGFNGRLDTMQAAILLEKLAIFDDELKARNRVAARYDARFAGLDNFPSRPDNVQPSWGLYSLTFADRGAVQAALKDAGIPCAVYYATPCHKMEPFAPFTPEGGLPNTDWLADHILSLPIHPYMTEDEADRVADVVLGVV